MLLPKLIEKYAFTPHLISDEEIKAQEKEEKDARVKAVLQREFCDRNDLAHTLMFFKGEDFKISKVANINIFSNTLVAGNFGVGKTISVLYNVYRALLNESLTSFKYAMFYNVFGAKYERGLKEYKGKELLILDEFCTLKTINREDVNLVIHEILDARMTKGYKTILITNTHLSFFEKEKPLEGSIVSRLKAFKKSALKGEDLRGAKNG